MIVLKYGAVVPENAVNLAYINMPAVAVDDIVRIADMAKLAPYNIDKKETVYTDTIGIASVIGYSETNPYEEIQSSIYMLPPIMDDAGCIRVMIKPGLIRRSGVVQAGDESWIADWYTPGEQVTFIYTVPELTFESSDTQTIDEDALITGAREITLLNNDVVSINSLKINDSVIDLSKVQVDLYSGIIRLLDRSISDSDYISVNYTYRTNGIPFYGFYDISESGYFTSRDTVFRGLDLNPEAGHTYDQDKPSSELIGKAISIYLLPSAAYSKSGNTISIRSPSEQGYPFLRWDAETLQTLPDIYLTSDTVSTYGSAKYDINRFNMDTAISGYDTYIVDSNSISKYPSALLLGRIYVGAELSLGDIEIIDSRSRGGGVSPDPEERRKTMTPSELEESELLWDIGGWDGKPIMTNGIAVVELPEYILKSRGGRFDEKEVEQIVKTRFPVGSYPIIKYKQFTIEDEKAEHIDTLHVKLTRPNILEIISVQKDGLDVQYASVDYANGIVEFNDSIEDCVITVTYRC